MRPPDISVVPLPAEACRLWLTACERAGATILVPAIAYYESLREIERRKATGQRDRLRQYCFGAGRFLPLNTAHLEQAATLWAQARNSGIPTANDASLDGDTILAAQVLGLGLDAAEYVVATTNPKHLIRFGLSAELWENITP